MGVDCHCCPTTTLAPNMAPVDRRLWVWSGWRQKTPYALSSPTNTLNEIDLLVPHWRCLAYTSTMGY